MFEWINDNSETFLKRGYLLEGVEPEQRVRQIADHAEKRLKKMAAESDRGYIPSYFDGFANKFYEYMGRGYYSLASPVWANFGLDRGLPISCFGSYIGDSIDSIMSTHAEVGAMTAVGGGTSGYFGDLRPRGSEVSNNGKSTGSYSFARLFDQLIKIVSQGEVRKGYFAGYIDIEHDDIEEWLNIQKEGDKIQTMYYGVSVGDDWMEEMVAGDLEKRKKWAKVIEARMSLGAPYVFFRDNVRRGRPEVYKDRGYEIKASNLCSEIALPSNSEESFVCCLSSINALHYEDWKDTDAVETLTFFLDAVMEEFVQKSASTDHLERARRFARRHRAIGIGVLGWHSYLQSQMIPFDSFEASTINAELFSTIKERSYSASEELAEVLGEPPVMEGYGRRNATTMAVAPTKSSSFILGQVSQSVQPIQSNYVVQDRAKMKITNKNDHLKELLAEYGKDDARTWGSIADHDGSVQHLDFLSDHEKDVFRTFGEIPQIGIIKQAQQRQQFIDQSQSLNLAINTAKISTKDLNKLHIEAWKGGVKTLYYIHNVNAAQEFARDIMECRSCGA